MAYTAQQVQDHIKELQTYLHSIALNNPKVTLVIPDGFYGRETQAAIKDFQNEYGLPSTGEADKDTWDKISSVYRSFNQAKPEPIYAFPRGNYKMKYGSSGYTVYIFQTMLNALSEKYNRLEVVDINGKYDQKTVKAVKQIQMMSKHPPTGVTDKNTWNVVTKFFNWYTANSSAD